MASTRSVSRKNGSSPAVEAAGLVLCVFSLAFALPSRASEPSPLFVFHDPGSPHVDLNAGVDARHLWYEDLSRTPYSECWYYLFFGEDGTIFFCHINLARMTSLVPAQYSLDFNLIVPGAEPVFFGDSYKKGAVEWKTDRLFVKLGPNVLQGDLDRQTLHIEELGYRIDLAFDRQVAPYRDGCGRIYLDRRRTNYLDIMYQPSMNVSGHLQSDGKTSTLKGWGYADHVRQTFIPTTFAKTLYAFRIRMGDLFITCLEYFPNAEFRRDRVATMIVAHRDKILHVSHDYSLDPTQWHKDHHTGAQVPASFTLAERTTGFTLEGTAQGDLLQRVDLLGAVKPFQKKILQLVGIRSYSYVFKERVSCKLYCPEAQGLFSGTGLFEVVVSD